MTRSIDLSRILLVVGLACALALAFTASAQAAIFQVNSTADESDLVPGDGSCLTASLECTVRAGVEESNALDSDDTVMVPAGRYRLTEGQLEAVDNGRLHILGAGKYGRGTAIDANGGSRVIFTPENVWLRVRGVSITGGFTGSGAGIVTGDDSVLKVIHARVNGNVATNDGGGIQFFGRRLVIRGSDIARNGADDDGAGIDIPSGAGTAPSVLIENSRVVGNASDSDGGGVMVSRSDAEVELLRSVVANNVAAGDGGGIYIGSGAVRLITSTVSGNVSDVNFGGSGTGAGIFMESLADLDARHSTIADNLNVNDNDEAGGGIDLEDGATATFSNTLIAENRTNGMLDNCDTSDDGGGTITSNGHNLEDGTDCGFTRGDDLQVDNPRLGRLRLNGPGRTETHRIAKSSPAIDAGPNRCRARDQRGVRRPRGSSCDIGAFERK